MVVFILAASVRASLEGVRVASFRAQAQIAQARSAAVVPAEPGRATPVLTHSPAGTAIIHVYR